MLKAIDQFVRMRESTRSVKVAQKCLIAVVLVDVDLPYWTSKVEHLVAFALLSATFVLRSAETVIYALPCKFRQRRSIRRP